MDKFNSFLSKYGLIISITLSVFIILKSCNTNKKIKRFNTNVIKLTKELEVQDSVISQMITKEDVEQIIKIEGLKISKRNLYDQNSIVRTKVRPDDRMNEYDQEIESLKKQK